jgi:putative two-component system response regulator
MIRTTDTDPRRASTVLVVDDEPSVRGLLVRWLSDAGYPCREACDADQAWNVLHQDDIGLMTLDITLPGRSGLELLPQVKEAFDETEVVMLTALGETKIAIAALSMGASGYLIKPADREELLFQVAKGLERRQLLIDKRHYTQHLEDRVCQQTIQIRAAHEETIHRLVAASQYRDEETGAHIRRVGLYSGLVAETMGWPIHRVEQIRMAAPMHDVGKIGIPDAILRKPGKLTPDEYEIMKRHTVIGARILSGSVSPMLQMAEQIARCHHERWDGNGYPDKLAREAIPEPARIVAIVDVFDALTHDRVYRHALPIDEAATAIDEGAGTQFDPHVVNTFFEALPNVLRIFEETPDDRLSHIVPLAASIFPPLLEESPPILATY